MVDPTNHRHRTSSRTLAANSTTSNTTIYLHTNTSYHTTSHASQPHNHRRRKPPSMPELPEVEAARRAIEDHCLGKKIKKATIADDPKVIDGVSPSDFEAALVDKTIISALRKGKNLWLQLDSPPFPSFQFGMTGAIYLKGVAVTKYKRSAINNTDEWPSKYSKLFIELDDGLELSFTDKRRFAKVRLLKDPASVPPISELGPDALLEPMTVDELYESLHKKKIAIKALLLDQSFISGIGNWVADEVLYQARIHPLQIVSSLSKESCATLLKCIKEVIEKAVEVGADSSQYPNNWIFHSREKKPGKAFVYGKKIDFINAGGRTTAYVPELQKLNGGQAAKAAGKPKRQTSKRKKGENDDDGDENEDANETASEEEEAAQKAKSKKELKPRGPVKKPSAKQMRNENDDEEDDNEPAIEEEKAAKNAEAKRELKPRGHVRKPPTKRKSKASDENDEEENDNEAASKEEEAAKKVKSKRELKTRGHVKKPPTKRKSNAKDGNDDMEDEDEPASEEQETAKKAKSKGALKPQGRVKKPPTKRQSKASDDNDDEDDDGAYHDDNCNIDENDEEEDQKWKPQGGANDKQGKAKKVSNENTTDQNSSKPKRKVK